MDYEDIEMYHDIGLMPNWAYYQQCGITPTQNLWKSTGSLDEYYRNRRLEEYYNKELEQKIEKAVEKALESLLTDKKIDINLQI